MQNNDLDNSPAPLLYIVWEGLIATCGEMKKVQALVKLRRYKKALALFQTQTVAVDAMWQAMMHRPYDVAVLTYLPPSLAEFLPERLDSELIPHRGEVRISSPGEMVQQIPHMPWLLGIADPELYRARAYGSFGRFVPPEHAYMIGGLC